MLTLTFDDCYASQKKEAQHLLNTKGLKGSFYVITDRMESLDDYYMTKNDILELARDGHEIGCHTKSHPRLSRLTETSLLDEVGGSRKLLQQAGIDVSTFVYPYGNYNSKVLHKVSHEGYMCARTTIFGYNDMHTKPFLLKCQPVYRWVPFFLIKYWIDYAERNNLWLILMFHQIDGDVMKYYGCNPKMFGRIIEYISSKKINTVTMAEGYRLTHKVQ